MSRRLPPVAAAAASVVLALTLVACAPAGSTPARTSSGGTMPGSSTPTPSSASSERPPFGTTTPGPLPSGAVSGPPVDVPAARWEAMSSVLAERGVTAQPELVSAEQVAWPDGAIGCPRPGVSYTQGVVEGARVIVRADGRLWDFHFVTSSDTPLLCENGRPAA